MLEDKSREELDPDLEWRRISCFLDIRKNNLKDFIVYHNK